MPDGPKRLVIVSRDGSAEEAKFERMIADRTVGNPELKVWSCIGMMACLYDREEAINQMLLFLADSKESDTEFIKLARVVFGRHIRLTLENWNGRVDA